MKMSINWELSKPSNLATIIGMSYLSNELRAARKTKGLTQEDVASLLGIRQENYNSIENGRRAVSDKRLTELAKILDIDHNELISCKLLDEFGESVFVAGYERVVKSNDRN